MQYEPRAYQRMTTAHIVDNDGAGVFIDCGMGKTVSALTAFYELKFDCLQVDSMLVVAPNMVARSTWSRECAKWDHLKNLRVSLIVGTAEQRVAAVRVKADIYVISRDNLVWLINAWGSKWPYRMVVLDESTSFKNPEAKRFKAFKKICDAGLVERVIDLTGTPSPKSYLDLWAQIYLLDGGKRLYPNYFQYRARFFKPGRQSRDRVFEWVLVEGAREMILDAISDICISLKAEDYLELPDVIEQDVIVELDPPSRAKYKEFERSAILRAVEEAGGAEQVVVAGTAAVLQNKLIQLCNGSMYDENKSVVKVHDGKVDALQETLEALRGNNVIVFYGFLFDIEDVYRAAKAAGITEVRQMKTAQDEADWNAGKIEVLIAHPASSGRGLNLQDGGHHIVWYSLPWNYEDYYQSMRRLARPGQEAEKVIMHRLIVAGGADEDVAAALTRKEAAQEYLLSALRARVQEAVGGRR